MIHPRQYKYYTAALRLFAAAACLLLSGPAVAGIPADSSSAVVFVYQHIGDDSTAPGSISLEQFRAHVNEMKTEGYNVLPLPEIVDALKAGKPLPVKTVALTFDGAWLSTLNDAIPLLSAAKLPYTVFYASDLVDAGTPSHMTWKQLKALKRDKLATLGILPDNYVHMAALPPERSAARINKAVSRYREEIGGEPLFFAYPYGEYSADLKKQLADYPFAAAFGQQSGVAHKDADFSALPRFTLTEAFGGLDRFQLTTHALPLPVTDVIPEDMLVTQNPPMIGFTVTPEITNLSRLSCFVSGLGKVELTRLGNNRIEIRLAEKLIDRSTRVNCTMPVDEVVAGQPPSWRWFGMLLILPEAVTDESAPQNPESEE